MRPIAVTLAFLASCSEYEIAKYDGVDVFYQDPPAAVDVLIVVDNSGSMAPFQEKLATEFDGFVSYFESAQVDYQVAVTTTAVAPSIPYGDCTPAIIDDLPAPGEIVDGTIITAETPDADDVFADLVSVGTCGSASEMGLEAAWIALGIKGDDENAAFLRNNAMLSVLIVSDEQDSSPRPVHEYLNDIQTQVKDPDIRDSFNLSGFVVTEVDNCEGDQAMNARVGTRYLEGIEQTSGVKADICADDYTARIEDLSIRAARMLDTFYLSKTPDVSSIVVEINDEEWPCQDGAWTYQEVPNPDGDDGLVPAIVFERTSVPPPASTILVSYYGGGGDPIDFCSEETTGTVP